MPVLRLRAALVALCLIEAPILAAQTSTSAQDARTTSPQEARTTPRQHLDQAKRLIDGIDPMALDKDAARRVEELKRDVNELASGYLARTSDNASADTRSGDDRSVSPTGRADRPAGTTGSTGTSTPGSTGTQASGASSRGTRSPDWRSAYTTVENDLRGLLGSGSNVPSGSTTATTAPVQGGVANLRADVRGQLQEARSQLQLFYAGTVGQREKTPAEK